MLTDFPEWNAKKKKKKKISNNNLLSCSSGKCKIFLSHAYTVGMCSNKIKPPEPLYQTRFSFLSLRCIVLLWLLSRLIKIPGSLFLQISAVIVALCNANVETTLWGAKNTCLYNYSFVVVCCFGCYSAPSLVFFCVIPEEWKSHGNDWRFFVSDLCTQWEIQDGCNLIRRRSKRLD